MSNPKSLPGTRQFAIHTKHVFHRNLKNATTAINNLTGLVLDVADWGFTWVRSFQVFSALPVHDGAEPNADDIAGSLFNDLTHEGGDPSAPLTAIGWTVVGGMVFSVGLETKEIDSRKLIASRESVTK